jgi:hypothetical protein
MPTITTHLYQPSSCRSPTPKQPNSSFHCEAWLHQLFWNANRVPKAAFSIKITLKDLTPLLTQPTSVGTSVHTLRCIFRAEHLSDRNMNIFNLIFSHKLKKPLRITAPPKNPQNETTFYRINLQGIIIYPHDCSQSQQASSPTFRMLFVESDKAYNWSHFETLSQFETPFLSHSEKIYTQKQ